MICVGGRRAKEIIEWLKKKVGPPMQPLASVEAAKSFAESADVVLIGFTKVFLPFHPVHMGTHLLNCI